MVVLFATVALMRSGLPGAETAAPVQDSWVDLDELLSTRVVTVSRSEQELFTTPAAVSVVAGKDVAARGVVSLPEAIRDVPGVNAGQSGPMTWAIGVRGFQWEFANKLLVMVDGRSVYSPSVGGVRWEDQLMYLDDIEHIEVVRGPGSSAWGANAVNGVISVQTRSALDTPGAGLLVGVGDELQLNAGFRQGLRLSDAAALRISGAFQSWDDSLLADGTAAHDGGDAGTMTARYDWEPSDENQLTLEGRFFTQKHRYHRMIGALDAPPDYVVDVDDWRRSTGGHVRVRWRHETSSGVSLEWQTYLDHVDREEPLTDERNLTLDSDFLASLARRNGHQVSLGLGLRVVDGEMVPGFFEYNPSDMNTELISMFVQDEWVIQEDRWTLTAGIKLEHHDPGGWEPQPSLRLAWTPADSVALWTSVSRAVRMPTWAETNLAADVRVYPPGVLDPVLPGALRTFGNPDLDAEILLAWEGGWRWRPAETVSLECTAFYYDTSDYVMIEIEGSGVQADPPAVVVGGRFINGIWGESYGGEISARWDAAPWWTLDASYSRVKIALHTDRADPFDYEDDENTAPQNTVRLQSSMRLGGAWTLQLGLRHVDEVSYYGIDEYTELDASLALRINDRWQVMVAGRNLLHDAHAEYDTAIYRGGSQIERSFFVQAQMR